MAVNFCGERGFGDECGERSRLTFMRDKMQRTTSAMWTYRISSFSTDQDTKCETFTFLLRSSALFADLDLKSDILTHFRGAPVSDLIY